MRKSESSLFLFGRRSEDMSLLSSSTFSDYVTGGNLGKKFDDGWKGVNRFTRDNWEFRGEQIFFFFDSEFGNLNMFF